MHPERQTTSIPRLLFPLLAAAICVGAFGAPARAQAPDGAHVPAQARTLAQPHVVAQARAPAHALGPAQAPELYSDQVVHEFTITFEQGGAWQDRLGCRRSGGPNQPPPSDEDEAATLVVDGETFEQVGVRCKGNSSLGIATAKKPLNITMDAFVDGQDLWGFDVVNLNNGWNDPSQVREALSLNVLGQVMPTPRFGFAAVTVNGEYLGLYTMVEQIDREFSNNFFGDDGLIIKGDSPVRIAFNSSALTWTGESLDTYKANYEAKGALADTDEPYVELRELIRALDAPVSAGGIDDSSFEEGIRAKLDVDAALWYLAGNNALANFDSYYVGKNYYLHRGEVDTSFHMIPWDMGLSFGIFGLIGGGPGGPGGGGPIGGDSSRVDPFAQEDDVGRPLIRRLLAVPSYRADYVAHYRHLLSSSFTPAWIESTGAAYQGLIRDSVLREAQSQGSIGGSYTVAHFDANLHDPVTVGSGRQVRTTPGVVSLTQTRHDYVRALAGFTDPNTVLAEHGIEPASPTAADPVRVTARFDGGAADSVELRYRVNGGREVRAPMTSSSGMWEMVVPAQAARSRVAYSFRAAFADGRAAFFPSANWTEPFTYSVAGVTLPRAEPGQLVVNELLADNESGLADPAGELDDWVEIYNRGETAVNLEGRFLSDREDDPFMFPLPAVELAPGGYLLIWCDNDPDQGPEHAPFRLDRAGEAVFLSSDEAILDSVVFGEQLPDVSYARRTSGAEEWILCASPSPGLPNDCTGTVPTPRPTETSSPEPTATQPTTTPTLPSPTQPPGEWVILLPHVRTE